jgi:hypothetical protein
LLFGNSEGEEVFVSPEFIARLIKVISRTHTSPLVSLDIGDNDRDAVTTVQEEVPLCKFFVLIYLFLGQKRLSGNTLSI